tara:strand:- start:1223 stop:2026 length:804 start_codon:yes stop_codon:yes gene_type:complete
MTRVNSNFKESGSNFSPDNGTGADVRTAMKDIFESLRTVNSAAGDPSGAANLAPYQIHINTSNAGSGEALLKIYNGSSFVTLGNVLETNFGFLAKTGGTLSGVLAASSGSASAPSLNFGDSSTGLFKTGTNQIGLTFAGSEKIILDQNGVTLQAQSDLRFADSDSSNFVALQAPATISSNFTLTLPATDSPVSGYALISNGSGTLSWGEAGSGAQGGGSDEIFWENDQTITQNYSITNGKNAGSFGPITIQSGVTVTVGSGETWTVV